jgi:hypothetical protein
MKEALKKELDELNELKSIFFDSKWNPIHERFSTSFLDKNPKYKALLTNLMPDLFDKIRVLEAHAEVTSAQGKYKDRKWLYIVFFTLVWLAIYNVWWAVMWFIIWWVVWNYFQPKKVVDRIMKKSLRDKKM